MTAILGSLEEYDMATDKVIVATMALLIRRFQ